MRVKKGGYVCQECNAYATKNADEAVPVCCGKGMVCMDEMDENEVYEKKESYAGM